MILKPANLGFEQGGQLLSLCLGKVPKSRLELFSIHNSILFCLDHGRRGGTKAV